MVATTLGNRVEYMRPDFRKHRIQFGYPSKTKTRYPCLLTPAKKIPLRNSMEFDFQSCSRFRSKLSEHRLDVLNHPGVHGLLKSIVCIGLESIAALGARTLAAGPFSVGIGLSELLLDRLIRRG